MCRMGAYIGPSLPLRDFLLQPEHSLLKQSFAPKEMREALMNADGFGFGWYGDEGAPAVYTNPDPMWNDPNLDGLGRALSRPVWLANARSATPGQGLGHTNIQPFVHANILYLHNGYIEGFSDGARAPFHDHLQPAVQAGIRGNTDSEFLFAVFRQCLADGEPDLLEALARTVATVARLVEGRRALLNFIVCDGRILAGCRHALNGGECPTLYTAHAPGPWPGASAIASEPFQQDDRWEPVAADTLFSMDAGGVRERRSL